MRGDARTLEIEEESPSRRTWNLFIYPDYLRFVADEGSGSFDVDFAQAGEELLLHTPLFGDPVLAVRQGKKMCFRLEREDFAEVKEWLGPPTMRSMKATLKQQSGWGSVWDSFCCSAPFPSRLIRKPISKRSPLIPSPELWASA